MTTDPTPRALTFDCYGTLVDWNRGIEEAIALVPSLAGLSAERRRAIRERREAIELERHLSRFRPYREILAQSLRDASGEEGLAVPEAEARAFAGSMGAWPPHPGVPEALARLRRRFRLAILSNVERAVLLESVRALGVPFDLLVTAEDVGAYKPALAHFERALADLDLPAESVLHVSYTPDHDLRPAQSLGIPTAWIRRPGAVPAPDLRPRFVVPSLAALADALAV